MNDLQDIARRAMVEHGLIPDFSSAALRELGSMHEAISMQLGVRDLRELLWSSIDNDDSRDLDQLTVAQALPEGSVRAFVAIADVDARVRIGSAIDNHARSNTTSVYTAARVFPMLPERLSTDLTSLNEDEERLALVIEMTIAANGDIEHSQVYRARVHNKAKLAYDSVAAWLDDAAPAPPGVDAVPGMDEQLRLQDRIARALRQVRRSRGALNFETTEARPVFKEERLTDLRADQRNRAKEMIEDFMVSANCVVATFLARQGRPSLRRSLRSPERWSRIVDLARDRGVQLPSEPDAIALNGFLTQCREADPQGFADLSLSVIKLLGSGEYGIHLPGQEAPEHFGLAVHEYTHATAPNRRFPDLVTQRLLKAALANEPDPYTTDELLGIAEHCNAQERNAAKVERQVRKAATAMLLSSRIGDRFTGIVTGASAKGTWVRVAHPIAEGKVVHGAEGLDVGDRVIVELIQVNAEKGFIDFARRGHSR